MGEKLKEKHLPIDFKSPKVKTGINMKSKVKWFDREITSIQTEDKKLSLMSLFIPLFVEQLLMNLMGTVNTLAMGRYSDDAVAAIGAANQVIGLIYTFYAVVSGGATIVISRRLGAGKNEEASDAAFTSLVFEGGMSLVFSLLLASFASPLMKMLNLEGEVLHMAENYFRICISFSFFRGVMSAASGILRSYGKPKPAVLVSLFINLLNAVFNIIIVFRPFEIPLYGTEGIGIANVISHGTGTVLIFICLFKSKINLNLREKNIHTLKSLGSILKVGIPGGVSSLSYSLSQVVSTSILAILGTVALSTKIYISSIVFYVYVIGMSLGLSTSILMGWMTGAKEYEKAYKLNQQVLKLSVLLNIVLSVLLFLFYRPLIGLFTTSEEILTMARGILFIDIFVEIGRAFNHVEDSSLKGAGDVVFPMIVSIISCWLISILFSYIFSIQLGWGLYGCWIAFMLDELFRGLIFWKRFRSKKWMNKVV